MHNHGCERCERLAYCTRRAVKDLLYDYPIWTVRCKSSDIDAGRLEIRNVDMDSH
jgi:hypothetical protein